MSSLKLKDIFSIFLCLAIPTFLFSQSNFLLRGVILRDTIENTPIENVQVSIEFTEHFTFTNRDGSFEIEFEKNEWLKRIRVVINDSLDFPINLYIDSGWVVSNNYFIGYFELLEYEDNYYYDEENYNDSITVIHDKDYYEYEDGLEKRYFDSIIALNDSVLFNKLISEKVIEIKQFPLDYPQPSAKYCIPWDEFKISGVKSFSKVDNKLLLALNSLDYNGSYYGIKNGFALVTQIEQINENGTSLNGIERWTLKVKGPNGFLDYFKSLLYAPVGNYRVFVFLVTDVNLHSDQSEHDELDQKEAMEFARNGYSHLPTSIVNKAFTDEHRITVLVYHYKKVQGKAVELVSNSFPVKTHLKKSGLYYKLQ